MIDTIDPLEDLAIQHVCKIGRKESLGDFDYGDGYAALKNEWRNMLSILDSVADKGMVVCLLAHSMVRQTSDPQLGPYEVYTTGLQKGTWAVTARWCDMIGFCAFQNARIKDEKRSVYTGQRELLTTAGSGYVAKNRWGLPRTLPMDWKQLDAAIKRFYDTTRPEDVVARIQALTKGNKEFEEGGVLHRGCQGGRSPAAPGGGRDQGEDRRDGEGGGRGCEGGNNRSVMTSLLLEVCREHLSKRKPQTIRRMLSAGL